MLRVIYAAEILFMAAFLAAILDSRLIELSQELNTTNIYPDNFTAQSCSIFIDPLNGTRGSTSCTNGWEYDPEYKHRSIVSEWDLVCDKSWQLSLGISIYFMGVMIGGLFGGYLADKIGRQPIILVGIYVQAILGLSVVFVQSYITFITIRFFQAVALQCFQSCSYTLMMEMLQPKMRDKASVLSSVGWTSGLAIIALIAWVLDDWRHVQLAMTLPSIVSFFYFWFIPESMRWLITLQKVDKAEALARKIAKFNKIELSADVRAQIKELCLDCSQKMHNSGTKNFTLLDLFRTSEIRKYTIICAFVWFTASVVTYGIAFGLSSIASNVYLSIIINNLIEISLCGIIILTDRFGRRRPVVATIGLSGIFCIIIPLILYFGGDNSASKTASTVAAITGKTFMSFTWAIITVYTIELYPTVIRSFGLGSVGFFTRIGGIISPQIALLGTVLWKPAPFLICGVLGITSAFCILLLPDTHNKPMPDVIEDVENRSSEKALKVKSVKKIMAETIQLDESNPQTRSDGIQNRAFAGDASPNMAVNSIDDFLISLGKPGRYQMISVLLLWTNVYPIAFNNIVMVFYGIIPSHQCKLPLDSNSTILNKSLQSCSVFVDPLNETLGSTSCPHGWDYDPKYKHRSIVSEWDLVCENKWQTSLGISIYFMGVMVGGMIGGFIADKIGRRPLILFGIYVQAILGLSVVFVRSYVAFVSIRFFQAIILQSYYSNSYTLAMEMLQPKMRDNFGVLSSFGWLSGMALMAGICWIVGEWRHVQLALTLPSIIAFFYFWFIPESMRWLITKQKVDKAEELARKIAKFNKIELSANVRAQIELFCLDCIKKERYCSNRKYTFIDLVRTPVIRKYTLILAFVGFTASVVTYGTAFGLSSIASNVYLSIVINNGLDMPLCGITLFLLRKVGRRISVSLTLGLSGIFCILVPIILYSAGETAASRTASTVVVIVGKTIMSFTWAIIAVYLVELFPTVIRGFGYGTHILLNRIGGIVAPQIALLGIVLWKPAPFLVCGILAVTAALLVLLLPDTTGKPLPNMIEDVENEMKTTLQEDTTETVETKFIDPHKCADKLINDEINSTIIV
uniref:Major facilitator superfamily (MFS) profile domain-containing protein n=1 Tax=Strigamia maritima TaxID=126957 RepID=T1IXG3_STRMM